MQTLEKYRGWRNPLLFALVMLLALGVITRYDPQGRNLDGDASFMLYAGQQILRGNAPYKTVGIVKLPFSPFTAAAGIAAGRVVGLADVLGGRYMFVLAAVLAVGATFLVGTQLGGTLVGGLSAAALLSFQTLSLHAARGPEAKMPLIAAGMFCVWLLARRKWFWAGVAGTCAFLTWQPGLIFLACALIAPWLQARSQRGRALWTAVAGVAAPLALVLLYFGAHDALRPMWDATFGANRNYFQNTKVAVGLATVVTTNARLLWNMLLRCARPEVIFIYSGWLGMIGGTLILVARLGRGFLSSRSRTENSTAASPAGFLAQNQALLLHTVPLVISGAALVGFSFLDTQGCMDFVPVMPYFALGTGLVFALAVQLAAMGIARVTPRHATRALALLGVVAVLGVLVYGAQDALKQRPQRGLARQEQLVKTLTASLGPDDRIQQFGDATVFVVSGRQNATHFMHLGDKQGFGILAAEGVTIEGLVERLKDANPRMILLSRTRARGLIEPLYDWLDANYELQKVYRKQDGSTRGKTAVWWRKD